MLSLIVVHLTLEEEEAELADVEPPGSSGTGTQSRTVMGRLWKPTQTDRHFLFDWMLKVSCWLFSRAELPG